MRRRLQRASQVLRGRLRRAENGAMAIFIALTTCFVVIPLGAIAVDLGTQRVSRVDAQAVADTTALDMARLLAASGPTAVNDAAATTDASKNSGSIGNGMTVHVYTGTVSTVPSNFVSDQSLGCNGNTSNSYFTPSTASTATAVLVTVSNSVNFAIHGGSGGVCRSAIATAAQKACMTVDSYAAALNTGDSALLGILNKMLGTNVNSQVLSSSGVLTAGLNVLSFLNVLQTNLSLASADQVLSANVTAAQIAAAEVAALNNSGNVAAANVLQTLSANVNASTQMTIGSLLGISQGSGSALATTVNPLDLLAAAAQVANGTTPISVAVSSPPGALTGLSVNASVGSSPMTVCLGEGKRTMGQTSITATANINAPTTLTSAVTSLLNSLTGVLSGVLQGLGGLLGGDTYTLNSVTLGPINATVKLAAASGQVNSLTCNGGTPTGMNVTEGSSLAPATITVPIYVSGTHGWGGVLGIGRQTENATAQYNLTITTDSNGQTVAAVLSLPGAYTTPQNGPSNNLSLQNANIGVLTSNVGQFAHGTGGASSGQKTIDGLFGLNTTFSMLNQIQSTILSPLEATVLTPLFTTLTTALQQAVGTTIAGSTYLAWNPASCNVPKLAG